MTRVGFEGPIVVFEGARDIRCITTHFLKNGYRAVNTCGHDAHRTVLDGVREGNIKGVIGVRDADFERVNQVICTRDDVVFSDGHDLEMMLLMSGALDRLMSELSSEHKMCEFLSRYEFPDLRTALYTRTRPIGVLRLLNHNYGFNLKFDGVNFSGLIDRDSLKVDERKLIQVVAHRSNADQRIAEIAGLYGKLSEHNYDFVELLCGHDVVEVLSIGLKKALGTQTGHIANPDNIERNLRLAFDSKFFAMTSLYKDIRDWEQSNGLNLIS